MMETTMIDDPRGFALAESLALRQKHANAHRTAWLLDTTPVEVPLTHGHIRRGRLLRFLRDQPRRWLEETDARRKQRLPIVVVRQSPPAPTPVHDTVEIPRGAR